MPPIFDWECEKCTHTFESMENSSVQLVACEKCGSPSHKVHLKAPTWDWSDKILDHKVNRYNKQNPTKKRNPNG